MLHSLRFRLFLTLIFVVIVAVGTVAWFTSRVTTQEFQSYLAKDLERNQRLRDVFQTFYATGESDVQPLLDQALQTYNQRVLVTDHAGKVIGDSAQQMVGTQLGCQSLDDAVVISLGSSPCFNGTTADQLAFIATDADPPGSAPVVFSIRRPVGSGPDPIAAGFLSSVNHSLALAVVLASVAALLLTIALSRRILHPIEVLTAAAGKLAKGDLSQRVDVQSKDEIGDLTRAFNAMADGLARVEQLRRNMVTDVAHELRTPLTNIRGYLEAIRDGVAEPSAPLIASLYDEAMLLNRLVDDLQELALAEAGQLSLIRQPIAMDALVEQAVHAVQPMLSNKKLAVSVSLPPALPPVDADPRRIGQVLRNLLNNAITHTPPDGQIEISATSADGKVAMSVRDTGVGIDSANLPYVFDRFFRSDRSRARSTGGAGLGLAIVKQLVELHGGQVWVESAPGHGSTFTFTLPTAA